MYLKTEYVTGVDQKYQSRTEKTHLPLNKPKQYNRIFFDCQQTFKQSEKQSIVGSFSTDDTNE